VILLAALLCLSACERAEDTPFDPADLPVRTVVMFMPWTENLTPNLEQNLADMHSALTRGFLPDQRVLTLFSPSAARTLLVELLRDGRRDTLTTYPYAPQSADEMRQLFRSAATAAPAQAYGLTVSAHGLGWVPPADYTRALPEGKAHWEGELPTRWFGGANARIAVESLADAIAGSGMNLDYLIFDACYMANIESLYALREAAPVIVACPTELMAYGMPWADMAPALGTEPDWELLTDKFLTFYEAYKSPYGTITAVDATRLSAVAAAMRALNGRCEWNPSNVTAVQRCCGYNPRLFFDLQSYAQWLGDTGDVAQAVASAVIASRHTAQYYSGVNGVNVIGSTWCGINVSDPSTHTWARSKETTEWWAATH